MMADPMHGLDLWDTELVQELAEVIYRVECNWDREGSGPGSRFEGECREHAQARGVMRYLMARRRLINDMTWKAAS